MSSAWTRPPRVVGHRGAPRVAPENTLTSFRAAVALGARAVELDARLTRDGEVVVHHDATLGRTVAGVGLVEEMTAAELRALDAGSWFSARFADARVPTLDEVLRAFPDLLVDVELKADGATAGRLPARAAAIVEDAGAQERVLVTSFDPDLAQAYAERCGVETGAICPLPFGPEDLEDWPGVRHVALVREAASERAVRALVDGDYHVHVWTVNTPAEAEALLSFGASSLITDEPEALLRALRGAAVR